MAAKKKKVTKKTVNKSVKMNKPTISISRGEYYYKDKAKSRGWLFTVKIKNNAEYAGKIQYSIDLKVKLSGGMGAHGNKTWNRGNGSVKTSSGKEHSFTVFLDEKEFYPTDQDDNDTQFGGSVTSATAYAQSIYVTAKATDGKTTTKTETKKNVETTTKTAHTNSDQASSTYNIQDPHKPSVALSIEGDGDKSVSYTVNMPNDSNSHNITTKTKARFYSQVKGGSTKVVKTHVVSRQTAGRDETYKEKKVLNLPPTTPTKLILKAYGMGPHGRGSTVETSHVFSKPNIPSITSVTPNSNKIVNAQGGTVHNGNYHVVWDINTENGWRPVDSFEIEYSDQDTLTITGDSWSSAISVNGNMRGVDINKIGSIPDGQARYIRVVAYHDGFSNESGAKLVGYGKPDKLEGFDARLAQTTDGQRIVLSWDNPNTKIFDNARIVLYRDNEKNIIKEIRYGSNEWPKTGNCKPYEYTGQKEGETSEYGARVIIGSGGQEVQSEISWTNKIKVPYMPKNVTGTKQANNTAVDVTWENPVKADDIYNGVEIAWSTVADAWNSNEQPSTTTFENGAMELAHIVGLTAGEVYYFWVRLYEESSDGNTQYGLWSNPSPGILLADKPNIPVLTLSRSWIKLGGSLAVQWTYSASGNTPQKNAQIEISKDKEVWRQLNSIDGEETKCSVDLNIIEKGEYAYGYGEYWLRVVVENIVSTEYSEPVALKVAKKPTCEILRTSLVNKTHDKIETSDNNFEDVKILTLTKLPLTVEVYGTGDLSLSLYCAEDFSWHHPNRTDTVYSGDCIWTSSVQNGEVMINSTTFADNARYRLQLVAEDPDTGLRSDPAFVEFLVSFEYQPTIANGSIVTIDQNENGCNIAYLVPVKPSEAADTDQCDIYRTTPDGKYLCMHNAPWGETIIDELPSFGEDMYMAYCFCTRSSDGVEIWTDIEYDLEGTGVAINFGDNELLLPWNTSFDDSRTKQGEVRYHMGGSKSYYSQKGIERTQNITTELFKNEHEDLVNKLYELSRHTEICYVRTSHGLGYPANVEVSLNRGYNNVIVSANISATEVDDNDSFLGHLYSDE